MSILSVAFLLCVHADDVNSTTVTNLITDKVIDKIKESINKLNDAVTSTKEFLDATAQKQACNGYGYPILYIILVQPHSI